MTKKEPKDERIKAIIDAAVDEFLESGYEGASMEAIARRAGISKGGLYHHFKGKDEVLLLANEKLNEPRVEMVREALQKTSAVQGLTWYIRKYLQYWQEHKKEMVFFFLSLAKMLNTPSLWQMYENYSERYIAFFRKLYEKGVASGEFVPHSTYGSAITMMAALDGIVGYLVMDKELNIETILSVYQEKYINSYLKTRNKQQNPQGE